MVMVVHVRVVAGGVTEGGEGVGGGGGVVVW